MILLNLEIPDKMVLIDTTIWIEFFKSNPDYFEEVESLLEDQQVIIIEPVFAELIYGSRSKKERNAIISYWKVLPKIKFAENSLMDAADFANINNYHNLGIGLIDSVLSKVVTENNYQIWTLDKKILKNLEEKYIYK